MKIASLFFLLLTSTIAFAQDANAAPKGNNLGAILLVIGLIVFLVVARKMVDKRNAKDGGGKKGKNVPVVKENIYEPKYWYQCKNCRVTIRKDTMPNSADCFQAPDHHWTEMAEVGTIKYLCRNCSTLIETRTPPVSENCPDAPSHDWERLG